jgi:hypothetical protein
VGGHTGPDNSPDHMNDQDQKIRTHSPAPAKVNDL